MPYVPNKVVGTDTIRQLTEKVNLVMDGVKEVEQSQGEKFETLLNANDGHRHTGLPGDAPKIGLDSLEKDVITALENKSCLFWMEV